MIRYTFYQKNPSSHYIYIDLTVDGISSDMVQLQLPTWRPGRYELGNFAKNIKRVDVFNQNGEIVAYTKLNNALWQVNTKGCSSLKVTYSYFAAELNAGACFADENQLYVNPVHCCMYVIGRTNEEHVIELTIPENYRIATSLKQHGKELVASDYEELVDSPFVASKELQTDHYETKGVKFHLHFNGICKPDYSLIKKDFSAFTKKLIEFWGDFPYNDFHFIFQIVPYKFYHGVEHKKSTVIAIGPSFAINSGSTYEDVLGVSCHELFHVWNVKTIRPVEMLPYDYTKENYSRTGFVYEGFTTYYGDKLLLGSSVFNTKQYFHTLQERLQKHFHNYGRYNLSVADSSRETWLDGYVPGAPYRKTNIYDEGSLIAFILDVKILEATRNQKSLQTVCMLLYQRFGKKQKGYAEQDILALVNEVAGADFSKFFETHIYAPSDFEAQLQECFNYLGIHFKKENSGLESEHLYGFKTLDNGFFSKISLVAPYSPAWKAGLFAGDEIMAVNNVVLKNNLNQWLIYFSTNESISLTVNSNERLKTISLSKDKKGGTYFFNPILELLSTSNSETLTNFETWKTC